MKRTTAWVLALGWLASAVGQPGWADSDPTSAGAGPTGTSASAPALSRSSGVRLYRVHCAACHGETGHGDGPDAALFLPKPRDLRDGSLAAHPIDELVRRIRGGPPLILRFDRAAMRARVGQVDEIVKHLRRLPDVDWRLVERGEEIYVDRCEICHGPYGRGPVIAAGVQRPPRDLSDPAFQASIADRKLKAVVRHGRKGMPAIPALRSSSDVEPLIAFVRLLSPGYELYSRNCAGCHGEDGRAASVFLDTDRRPSVIFDRRYFARADSEDLKTKVWHMLTEREPGMPHFRRQLSEEEARTIVEFLLRGE